MESTEENYYNLQLEQIYEKFQTDPDKGLTEKDPDLVVGRQGFFPALSLANPSILVQHQGGRRIIVAHGRARR